MPEHKGRRWISGRAIAIGGCATLLGGLALAGQATPGAAATTAAVPRVAFHATTDSTCHLGNGIKHVVQLTFDNVHFFRDNPNVPSDLQMMPNLLNFFENNGTFLSNNHTPLIAHTANDILTTLTGLYGDRHGMSAGNNAYRSFNPDGTTDPASAFAYWTDPIFDTASTPTTGHDTNPSMVYSPTPPATTYPAPQPNTIAPAPWAPYTRAGCDAGYIGTANVELENTSVDIPKVFGPDSPEAQQLAADPDTLQGRRDGGLRRRRGALRAGQRVLRGRPGHQVRPDLAKPHRLSRPAAERARWLQRVPGAVRAPLRRSPDRGGHAERDAQRVPRSPTPPGTSWT